MAWSLDQMRPKKEVQRATELKWLDGFGRTSFFLKNDKGCIRTYYSLAPGRLVIYQQDFVPTIL